MLIVDSRDCRLLISDVLLISSIVHPDSFSLYLSYLTPDFSCFDIGCLCHALFSPALREIDIFSDLFSFSSSNLSSLSPYLNDIGSAAPKNEGRLCRSPVPRPPSPSPLLSSSAKPTTDKKAAEHSVGRLNCNCGNSTPRVSINCLSQIAYRGDAAQTLISQNIHACLTGSYGLNQRPLFYAAKRALCRPLSGSIYAVKRH